MEEVEIAAGEEGSCQTVGTICNIGSPAVWEGTRIRVRVGLLA